MELQVEVVYYIPWPGITAIHLIQEVALGIPNRACKSTLRTRIHCTFNAWWEWTIIISDWETVVNKRLPMHFQFDTITPAINPVQASYIYPGLIYLGLLKKERASLGKNQHDTNTSCQVLGLRITPMLGSHLTVSACSKSNKSISSRRKLKPWGAEI